jgi:hypothetical protein
MRLTRVKPTATGAAPTEDSPQKQLESKSNYSPLQEQQQQQQSNQEQSSRQRVPSLQKRTSVVMSHRLQHTRFAAQGHSPQVSPKIAPSQPPAQSLSSASHELTSRTKVSPPSSPTVMKVYHESDAGAVASHTIKYNQTSTAADVTSYVVRKMQLLPAAYELVFCAQDSFCSDDILIKCKSDTLLTDVAALYSGSRGRWWVRLHQPSHSDLKIENEWLRKELEEAAERQKEAFEREKVAAARLRDAVEHAEQLEHEIRRHRLSRESLMLWSKEKTLSINGMVEKLAVSGSHLQVN